MFATFNQKYLPPSTDLQRIVKLSQTDILAQVIQAFAKLSLNFLAHGSDYTIARILYC